MTQEYTWNGNSFINTPLQFELVPVTGLEAYCEVVLDEASSGWGPEAAITIANSILDTWPPETDTQGHPYPADAYDQLRYRLGVLYALADQPADAIRIMTRIINTPIVPDIATAAPSFESFKSGLVRLRNEDDPTRWTEGYDFPAASDGRAEGGAAGRDAGRHVGARVQHAASAVRRSARARGADQAVRLRMGEPHALSRSICAHGKLFRAVGAQLARQPADPAERTLLAPFADAVKPSIMDGSFAFPVSDGSGENREGRREALQLLEAAGYRLSDGKLVNAATGEPVVIEILAATRAQERLLLTYAQALKQVGIEAEIRQVDSAQYQRRKQTYDFDMIQYSWPVSLSPGNEQSFRWGSEAAVTEGSFNYPGIKSPAVDAMIEALLKAQDRDDFVSATRALDRVLLSGDYVIPLFYLPRQWVAHWNDLKRPEKTPLYGYQIDSWWLEPEAGASGSETGQVP